MLFVVGGKRISKGFFAAEKISVALSSSLCFDILTFVMFLHRYNSCEEENSHTKNDDSRI